MLIVRPARSDDFEAFFELARLSGPGFTSLPENEEMLRGRIDKSVAAFDADVGRAGEEAYLLMLEDTRTGEVRGCAAVKAGIGVSKPFYNLRLFKITQASQQADVRFDMNLAVLVNDFSGSTEVGTLFVHPEARGGGVGRLLAQSRYLLMAAAPQRFHSRVIAELRGVFDEQGRSPFWEGAIRKFFRMEFDAADELSGTSDNQFIHDLMPKHPIYLDLLPEDARTAVGEVHEDGRGAKRLLEWEGFRYDRFIDVFDGGPLVSATRDDIRTISESRSGLLRVGDVGEGARSALLSTDRFPDFRVCRTRVGVSDDGFVISQDAATALKLAEGDTARIWAAEQEGS